MACDDCAGVSAIDRTFVVEVSRPGSVLTLHIRKQGSAVILPRIGTG